MGNQSSVIFGFLFVAFFVYITTKGELPVYAGLLLLSPGATPTTPQSTAQANQTTQLSQVTEGIIEGAIAALGLV
jgi:hypothetical protein